MALGLPDVVEAALGGVLVVVEDVEEFLACEIARLMSFIFGR